MKKMLSSVLRHPACTLLAIFFTIVLMIPNVALCFTESMGFWAGLANVVLPLGFYMLLISLFRHTGWAVWAMLPFSVLAAFQIVLLFLYGGSIIAVDMFLNVVTTNMSEACELLGNLGSAIFTVVVLYLPALIWATVSLIRKKELMPVPRIMFRRGGAVLFFVGVAAAMVASVTGRNYSVTEDVFPLNVIYNIKVAVDRTAMAERYDETSSGFCFNAVSEHDADEAEVYVMVIGETSRALNWQLGGYDRPTNPRLSQRKNVTFYSKALSESNTTHKSVPMLMSHVNACNFDSVGYVKSIITAFNEAGFRTAFISNQAPNHSYTEFFGREANRCIYLSDTLGRHRYDAEMLPYVAQCLADTTSLKQFIVLHSYGSHFKYTERYPDGFGNFKPDLCDEVKPESRDVLINAYDNTIEYTDHWLDNLMDMLERSGKRAALVYSADHGEDIMDDARCRFLHASPTPTYYQLHVAMLTWVSSSYDQARPEKLAAMKRHCDDPVSSTSSLFNTCLDLGGIETEYRDDSLSLASPCYRRSQPLYLNDQNRGVEFDDCGLKNEDVAMIMPLLVL